VRFQWNGDRIGSGRQRGQITGHANRETIASGKGQERGHTSSGETRGCRVRVSESALPVELARRQVVCIPGPGFWALFTCRPRALTLAFFFFALFGFFSSHPALANAIAFTEYVRITITIFNMERKGREREGESGEGRGEHLDLASQRSWHTSLSRFPVFHWKSTLWVYRKRFRSTRLPTKEQDGCGPQNGKNRVGSRRGRGEGGDCGEEEVMGDRGFEMLADA
jgi:hypothetical protein